MTEIAMADYLAAEEIKSVCAELNHITGLEKVAIIAQLGLTTLHYIKNFKEKYIELDTDMIEEGEYLLLSHRAKFYNDNLENLKIVTEISLRIVKYHNKMDLIRKAIKYNGLYNYGYRLYVIEYAENYLLNMLETT